MIGAVLRRFGSPLGAVVTEGFLSRLSFGILGFALPLYAHALGMTLASIGLLLATNVIVSIVLRPAMGALIDRFGVRISYLAAVALRSLVVLLFVFANAPWQLFAIRALHGVAIALRDPAATTIIAGLGGKATVAQRFAWYQTAKTVAGSSGRFAAGVVLTLTLGSYPAVFAVAAALSALPLGVMIWRLRGPALAGLRPPPTQPAEPVPTGLRRAVLPYAGLGFLVSGTAYMMANLLPVFAVEYIGLSPAAAGSLYLVSAIVGLSGPLWGWLADHVSNRLVLSLRAVGNVASSVVWLATPTYAGLLVGKVADDVGKAAFSPAWGAVMARLAERDPRRRARIMAWLGSAEDLGEMTGPIVAGLIWSLWGLPAVLMARVLLGIVTEVYALFLDRRDVLVTSAPVVPDGAGARSREDNEVATDSIAGSRGEPKSQRAAAPVDDRTPGSQATASGRTARHRSR
jgi:MFS family permease